MVKVVFYKCDGNFYGFQEFGHAGFDEAGRDIVCAAMSAMTMLIVNTIETVWGTDIDFTMNEETADVTLMVKEALPKYAKDEKTQYAIQGLFYSYYLQLNDMLEDYCDYLDVDCEIRDI